MLPMPTWVLLTSHQRMAGKSSGYVISAQMATCTAGMPLLPTGATAGVALSAAGAKCASTTPWPPRLPRWQLNGTMKRMIILLKMWSHKAIIQLVGCVRCVETSGMQHPVNGSASKRLAAHSVPELAEAKRGSGTQHLQIVETLRVKRAWHNGTMNAMHPRGTSLSESACTAKSKSSGSARNAQQGRSTVGLQCLVIETAATRQAVHSVLGMMPAVATPCRRCTLP